MRKRVVVVGSVNLDLVCSVERIPRAGETISGSRFEIFHGGKGANQAVAIARLGYPVSMVAKVGDSEYAHQFEVWTGVSYCAAANLYHWGERIGDGAFEANALLIGWGLYYTTWVNEQTAYWFSTPEAWRLEDPRRHRALMYQRARGIWELAMEVGDPYRV